MCHLKVLCFQTRALSCSGETTSNWALHLELTNMSRQTHRLLINSYKVLIAAINGPAVGYGTSSIALFDLVYSIPDAIFFTPFMYVSSAFRVYGGQQQS